MINQSIAHYEITGKLGQGGMGDVYRATDTKLDREVAIKVLPKSFAEDATRLARFEREAKVLAALNHPNIAVIYGIEQSVETQALIMELVEGETLGERLRRERMTVPEALDYCKQIAEALEAAHEKGIIHRDLKPDNVKITQDGRVKVLDFGLAKALVDGASSSAAEVDQADSPTLTNLNTVPGQLLGTAPYMSPEQARARAVDKRSDIWSFGCLLYECLTGKPTFHGEDVTDTLASIIKGEPDWAALPDDMPPAIELLLRKCLNKDRKRRLQDIGDARVDLEQAIADPSSSFIRLSEGALREARAKTGVPRIGAAGLVLTVAVISVALGWFLKPAPPIQLRKPPVRCLELGTSGGSNAMPAMPVIAPNGSRVVYLQGGRLWVRDLSSFDARELDETEGAIRPFWSPDGAWIGYSIGRRLMKSPARGGRPQQIALLPGATSPAGNGAWLEDDMIIVTTGSSELLAVSSRGGVPRVWLPVQEDEIDFHEVSGLPEGRGVVFVSHKKRGPWSVCVSDGDQRAEVIEAFTDRIFNPLYAEPGYILFEIQGANAGLWGVGFDVAGFKTTGEPFLITDEAKDSSVSRDGTLVYLRNSAARDYRLAWLPLNGGPGEPIGDPMPILRYPKVSPDGSRIVHVGGMDAGEIFVTDVASGQRRLITHGAESVYEPTWSPDGKRIAASLWSGDERRIEIYGADGSGRTGEPIEGESASFDPTWASAAVQRPGGSDQRDNIWFVPIDGSGEERAIVATGADEDWPRISPDGKWLLYRSDELGIREIYLTRYPSGEGRWQVTNSGAYRAEWGPEGDRIYCVGVADSSLTEIPIDTGDGVRIGTPRLLWDRSDNGFAYDRGFDVPPPGDRVLGVTTVGQGAGKRSIGIVQNWLEGLQANDK